MTTTASFYLFHKSTSIFWHEHNSTSIWHDHIKFLSYPQEHQQFDMETTATFYFSTRTLAVSGMTPITTPASDMTTTAAVSIFTTRTPVISHYHNSKFLSFPQEHKHFWHEHNSTSTWHDHNIKFLSYIQEHQQFDMDTTATFYFRTRTLAPSDMTPITAPVSDMTTTAANSIFPQEHKHFWHEHNSTSTWPDHNIKFLSYYKNTNNLTWTPQQLSTLGQEH